MSAINVEHVSVTDALAWLAGQGLDACELDDRTPIHEVLAQIPPSVRRREPACLAVRAALERFEGHVDTAVALYERALGLKMDEALELRIRENLAHLFGCRRQDTDSERALLPALRMAPADPRILSIQMTQRARRRDNRQIRYDASVFARRGRRTGAYIAASDVRRDARRCACRGRIRW
jgi:hypothetical protein